MSPVRPVLQRAAAFVPALAGLALVSFVLLQFRWTGDLARAERAELEVRVDAAARAFAEDLESRTAALRAAARVPSPTGAELAASARALAAWAGEGAGGELLDGALALVGGQVLVWDAAAERFEARVRADPGDAALLSGGAGRRRALAARPGIFVPFAAPAPGRSEEKSAGGIVLLFDPDVLGGLFDRIAREHLTGPSAMRAAVLAGERVIWSWPTDLSADAFARPDAQSSLFPTRVDWFATKAGDAGAPGGLLSWHDQTAKGPWRLALVHPAGSLAAAVVAGRRSNLLVAGGVLALFAFSLVLVLGNARRAGRLAGAQLELARARLVWVAGISHDLRTPLTALKGAAENLADGIVHDPKAVRAYGELVAAESERLAHRVEQAIALARGEAGSDPARFERLTVEECIEDVLRDRGDAGAVLEVEPGLCLWGVRDELRLALENLVENALRHGAPPVEVKARGAADEVWIEVQDRGAGVAADEEARLFEPFFRGRHARAGDGSGLGLAIVDRVARAHSGRVRHERLAGGTVFRLELPRRKDPS